MAADLHLVFSRDKSSRTLTITDPASDLTKSQVLKAMENIVSRRAILSNNQAVDGAKAAYLSEVVITELDEAEAA